MTLNHRELKNKILGCFNGKNAGGVLGAPFEQLPRGTNDVKFYVQENLNCNPPANDDLDLQLVWLVAAERYGAQVDSHILAEHWNTFITPDWAEYGAAKRNLSAGLLPPLSGSVANVYKDSNGAWIRTEIWACLAAAHPDIAVKYAIEDAIVDHAHEGVWATAFCAALESAAFAVSDVNALIDIAATYLPEDSGCLDAVRIVREAHEKGSTWQDCRLALFKKHPSSFGVGHVRLDSGLLDDGITGVRPGYDAPYSVGIITLALLYGEGDFERSLCLATNCGEDTDCTAGTVGAIIGIIKGNDALPEKWMAPLGGVINTCCIELNGGIDIPKTTSEVTERIMRLMPSFLSGKQLSITDNGYLLTPAAEMACPPEAVYTPGVLGHNKDCTLPVRTVMGLSPYAQRYEFFNTGVILDYGKPPFVKQGETFTLTLTLYDLMKGTLRGHFANIRIYADDGITLPSGNYISAPLQSTYTTKTHVSVPFTVERITAPVMSVILDIGVVGRPTSAQVKVTLYAGEHWCTEAEA